MQLLDGTKLHLDWTSIGGEEGRADRLLLSEDGYARRNRGGNLFTLDAMTAEEREELEALRERFTRLELERHSGPDAAHPNAYRLRFDGRGSAKSAEQIDAFAEGLLARLGHEAMLNESGVVVAAVVERDHQGRASLLVERVLKGTELKVGDRIRARPLLERWPDGRVGAGRATTVFVLSEHTDDVAYLKIAPEAAASIIGRSGSSF